MEAVGLVASTAQISAYIFSIANTIQDVRAYIKNAPLQLQDRIRQLDVLTDVLRRIEADPNLQTDRVARYLLVISRHISDLSGTLQVDAANLKKPTKRRLWSAFKTVGARKHVEDSFVELYRHCNTLGLYVSVSRGASSHLSSRSSSQQDGLLEMSSSRSSGPKTAKGIDGKQFPLRAVQPPQQQQQQLSPSGLEMVVARSPKSQSGPEPEMPTAKPKRVEKTGRQKTKSKYATEFKATVGNIHVGKNAVASHGNHTQAPPGSKIEQTYGNIEVLEGAKSKHGNTSGGMAYSDSSGESGDEFDDKESGTTGDGGQ